MHKMEDTHLVLTALKERSYKQMEHFVWYKPGQTEVGPAKKYTNAIEVGTLGFYKDRSQVLWNASEDPTLRHNYISVPSIRQPTKDSEGNVINPTEKPPEVAGWLLKNHCPPGSTCMVIGAGAGGDVIGGACNGINVIGVEVDLRMYKSLVARLEKTVAQQTAELEAEKSKQATSSTSSRAKSGGKSGGLMTAQDFSPSKGSNRLPECPECGDEVSADLDADIYYCHQCDDKRVFHPNCLNEIPMDSGDVKFVCETCWSEMDTQSNPEQSATF
jgi:DNA-directed RNA polymerase subunit RPC12/RpoP